MDPHATGIAANASQLVTLRFTKRDADGASAWYGRLYSVSTGQVCHFQTLEMLIVQLSELLNEITTHRVDEIKKFDSPDRPKGVMEMGQNNTSFVRRVTTRGSTVITHPVIDRSTTRIEGTQLFMTAAQALERKWNELGGAPGVPVTDMIMTADGYLREYEHGTLFGRTGQPTFYVYGAIGAKYRELGRQNSWLGYPTSDEQPFPQDGRASTFENGAIYWWADTGAIALGNVLVRYTGLYCFGETDWDQSSDSDEPYVLFGVVGATYDAPATMRTSIYDPNDEGVDAGDAVPDSIELYRGLPYGLAVSLTLMEHDFGDPDKFRETVKTGVAAAAHGVAGAAATVPAVGPLLALAVEGVMAAVGDEIVQAINDLFDTADDYVGTAALDLTAKDMITHADAPKQNFNGIEYDFESPLISGDGASYKVYLSIQAL